MVTVLQFSIVFEACHMSAVYCGTVVADAGERRVAWLVKANGARRLLTTSFGCFFHLEL